MNGVVAAAAASASEYQETFFEHQQLSKVSLLLLFCFC